MINNRDFLDNFNISAIRAEAIDRCDDIAERLLGKPSLHDRKEMRWGHHGSMALCLCGDRRGLWYSHENAQGGDMIALVREVMGYGFPDACLWLAEWMLAPVHRVTLRDDHEGTFTDWERIEHARRRWSEGKPAENTLVAAYFEGRGLDVPKDFWRSLRFLERNWFRKVEKNLPSVMVPIRCIKTREIDGIHLIALNDDGTGYLRPDGKKLKISMGRVKGGAMMIGEYPGEYLTVCEGLETAFGVIMGHINDDSPVWALAGASFLGMLEPVENVRFLTIAADNDPAGRKEANHCANQWDQDAFVDVVWPSVKGTDYADEHRRR